MKWKGLIIVGLVLSSIFLGAYYPNVNYSQKESLILNAVINYLDVLHFKPKSIDDDFSSQAFDEFIESVDPGKRFFIQSEIDQLSIYRDKIDDNVRNRSFEFFDAAYDIILTSRSRAEAIFNEMIENDFEIESQEFIEMDSKKRGHAATESELKDVWKKLLHFDIITRLEDKLKSQEEAKENESGEDIEIKSLEELMVEVKEETRESYTDWFKRIHKDRRSDFFEIYVNSITNIFDPHSDYFNPKEKQDFDIRIGGKLEGIGARLQTDGDFTKVVSIVPGGPAWKGKELEVNDMIHAVTQKGEEPVDIKGMRIDDVVQKIRGDKGTVVILKVKKSDGKLMDVEIERDEVIIDEGFARSLILDMEGELDNVGYIKLPKFYSSFEGKDGNSCAIDVAKEIEKLNNENVNAIILDLRNNGGGSLRDVVDMSGLFIEQGPIVQVKPRNKDPYLYEDEDSNVHFDGPLIVMVNQFSASASEILAAALQDYNRALIIGSTSTYGKGTVQRFVDLDRAYRDQNDLKPLGQLKITMQKFYRINGGSTQLKGVVPDIILPSNYQYIDTGEKDFDHAMEWSEIAPVDFTQGVYHIDNKVLIKQRSALRTSASNDFQMVLKNAERLKYNRDQSKYPMNLDAYIAYVDLRDEKAKEFENLFDSKIENLQAENLSIDTSYINFDESRVARNTDWLESIQKDFYLEEAMHIMKDLIDLNKEDKLGLEERG
ncbi:MAG: carboxy terminal-processing peptidase [Bacteroidia bacterium]|nr:carboxy terminal-processing peptidase [Bacteroidia bacterium]